MRFVSILVIALALQCCKSKEIPLPVKKNIRDTANIFILTGQSNALGQHPKGHILDQLPPAYRGRQKSVWVWRNGNFDSVQAAATLEQMEVPVNTRHKVYNDPANPYYEIVGWSVEQEWLHLAAAHYHKPVCLIKSARGGYSVSNWSDTSGQMYLELKTMIEDLGNHLQSKGKQPVFRGLVWMQGEADALLPDYYEQLKYFIQRLRGFSILTANIPFIMIRIPTYNLSYHPNVDQAFFRLNQDDPARNFIIDPSLLQGITYSDKVHLDDSSKLILGKKIFEFQLEHGQL